MWLKIVSQWITMILYMWSSWAPVGRGEGEEGGEYIEGGGEGGKGGGEDK